MLVNVLWSSIRRHERSRHDAIPTPPPTCSRPPATTSGCTSPAWAATRRARCRSSSAATAATSRTRTASATWTRSPACSRSTSATASARRSARPRSTQMRELPFYTNWSYAHPRAIELAAEVASLAPGDLNRVFFVSGGSEAVESAWKLARQYYLARGEKQVPRRATRRSATTSAVGRRRRASTRRSRGRSPTTGRRWARSRSTASRRCGRRSSRSCPRCGTCRTRTATTGRRRRPRRSSRVPARRPRGDDPRDGAGDGLPRPHGAGAERGWLLHAAGRLLARRPRALRPLRHPALGRRGDHSLRPRRPLVRLRALRHPARHRHAARRGSRPSYAAIGAVIATDRVMEPFLEATSMYSHGITFGGHPVMCAIALKNIEIMKRERIVEHVRENEDAFRATLEQLLDLPIVGDLRGTGYFYALELVKDKETRETFDDDECETLLRGFLSPRALRARPDLPRRRPRRPGDPDLAAARRRPGGVRRDRRDPRRRARGGRQADARELKLP